LTVGLQVQESTLRSFFDKSAGLARGTGFLARFLVAWPQSTQGKRLFKDAPGQWPKLAAYHQRIERILSVPTPMDDDGALTPSLIPLSAEAKAVWVEYHDEVETRLAVGGDYADVRDVASKSADNAARLAALFHIFENGGGGAISLEAMEAGCMVAVWHLQESRRFFGEIAVPVEMADAMRVIRWAVEVGRTQGGTVATRDLQRLGPVRSKDQSRRVQCKA
jgi:putative DNA primase/helicase